MDNYPRAVNKKEKSKGEILELELKFARGLKFGPERTPTVEIASSPKDDSEWFLKVTVGGELVGGELVGGELVYHLGPVTDKLIDMDNSYFKAKDNILTVGIAKAKVPGCKTQPSWLDECSTEKPRPDGLASWKGKPLEHK